MNNPDWSLLPPGALKKTFSYLNQEELSKVGCICKNWFEGVQNCMDSNSENYEEDNCWDINDFDEVQDSDDIEIPEEMNTEEGKPLRITEAVKKITNNVGKLEDRDSNTLNSVQKPDLEMLLSGM